MPVLAGVAEFHGEMQSPARVQPNVFCRSRGALVETKIATLTRRSNRFC